MDEGGAGREDRKEGRREGGMYSRWRAGRGPGQRPVGAIVVCCNVVSAECVSAFNGHIFTIEVKY